MPKAVGGAKSVVAIQTRKKLTICFVWVVCRDVAQAMEPPTVLFAEFAAEGQPTPLLQLPEAQPASLTWTHFEAQAGWSR